MAKAQGPGSRKRVAWCPHCHTGYTYAALKSLVAQSNRRKQMKLEGREVSPVICPACEQPLTDEEIRSMWGSATSNRRQRFGHGTGRPKDPVRCPCGAMTLARAISRG